MPAGLTHLPRTVIPLAPHGLVGIAARPGDRRGTRHRDHSRWPATPHRTLPPLADLIDDLAAHRHGVILTMGKGGVGKTTVAAAIAVALADRGFPVHLTTTDPAAHVAATLNGALPNLTVSRIDPKAETAAYSAEVMATAGQRPRRPGQGDAGGRPAVSLHGGDRRVPGVRGGRGERRATASSCSTPPRPATRSCCSTRPWPTTAR